MNLPSSSINFPSSPSAPFLSFTANSTASLLQNMDNYLSILNTTTTTHGNLSTPEPPPALELVNFTTSAKSSPFSTPYDAVQWSKQAVPSGPMFIGESGGAGSGGSSNFSNLTLPHWYNITFLLNISRDVPEDLGVVLFGYVLPFLLLLTLATNLLIVIVLSQSHMRTPTNLVLLAMAIADLFTLMSPAPWYFYLYTLGYHQNAIYPPRTCYIFHVMYEVLPALFHTYSIWLTLLLAGQRYVYVCHFSIARTWCTVPRVTKAMFGIFLIAVLHQSTRFFDRDFLTVRFIWEDKIYEGCEYLTANWVDYYIGEDVYYTFYYMFRIIFVHIFPCGALVFLNLLLFKALSRTQATRERLFAPSHDSYYSHSKASLPYNNCLTPMRYNSASGGGNNNNGSDAVDTSCNNRGSPEEATASTLLNSRKVSLELNCLGHNNATSRNNPIDPDNGTQNTEVTVVVASGVRSSSLIPSSTVTSPTLAATVAVNNLATLSPNQPGGPPQATQLSISASATSKRDANSTTIMLIVIVSMFLLLEIPLTITTILHVVQNTFPVSLVEYNTLNTIILITNFFIILSYPINFAIYCGMSRQFRLTFSELFIYGLLGRTKLGSAVGNGAGNGALVASERATNAITGASSSTFGVTTKSGTSCMTGQEGGGTPYMGERNGRVLNRANSSIDKSSDVGSSGSGGSFRTAKVLQIGSTEVIDYEPDSEPQVLETSL